MEQYGRRVCLSVDGIPLKINETSKYILDSVKNISEHAEVNISDVVVDCAHRNGRIYNDRASNKNYKGTIMRFKTFRHTTVLYRSTPKLKKVKVSLDLTKSRYDLWYNEFN